MTKNNKKKGSRNKITNWPRILMQWAVIAVILFLALRSGMNDSFVADFEAYCPFGGLQAIGSYLITGALACTMTSTQMVMGALLLIGVFLFSKLFCAYVCPVGTVSEFLGKLGARLKVRITIKGIPDLALRSLKYVLLFITLYFTFTSNELFCKQYDPFYAIVSGYDSDVTVLYATLAIAVTVLGAIFIRLFWCKYLCPLGAISNIFKFGWFFISVMGVYIALRLFGLELSFVWPLAIASAGGYVIELLGQKSRLFPLTKITRNTDTCTNCQLCTIKCPQGIDVANTEVVKHVDCNMCSECLHVCPEKETLQINRKKKLRWLSPVAIAVLFAVGLLLQSVWEVPTISEKWGDPAENVQMETYSREGLKNIKCYGSCRAFANTMRKVKGVYGISAFVGNKKVVIDYDPAVISQEQLEETLFTPQKTILQTLPKETEAVQEVSLLLENFFDAFDFSYLSSLLQQDGQASALVSEYACPVIVKIYFPEDVEIDEQALKELLESEILTYEVQGKKREVELKFEVVGDPEYSSMERGEYIRLLFSPYSRSFNKFKQYESAVLDTLSLPMGKNSRMNKRLPYLSSHVSNNDGIVKLETRLNEEYKQVLDVFYVDSMTNSADVLEMVCADSLMITYSNGRKEKVENMFDF